MNNSYNPNYYNSKRMIEYVGRLITTGSAGEDINIMDFVTLKEDGKIYKVSSKTENLYGIAVISSDLSGKFEYKKGDSVPVCIDLHGLLCYNLGLNAKVGQPVGVSLSKGKLVTGGFDVPLPYIIGEIRKRGEEFDAILHRMVTTNTQSTK